MSYHSFKMQIRKQEDFNMIYGYSRVSTTTQKNGNSLECQKMLLEQNGTEKIFNDSFIGMKSSSPELNKLLGMLIEGDTLVVTKLDRVARDCRKVTY